ncbi:branched-subunit amino acid transport protein AzlD [Desulfitobacterium sp. LBE]|uniref:Branched-chain amino acid transport protein AzlD n=1 Tax=Desulfitobacterium chlororespirans DSM 11544 TaxID=1121395 RepID=A0A1M7U6Z1_9FIRM|nr:MULTISPECIES: AzlD domain-containing protein [Desulfitobacterium]TWH60652.1 branched-subunit amino acid transport protein AzlD [Desulfitobacterium sp. LBE]SHN78676.1 Branched-chain amino acid transport protein AzlD [Desulfitobacterium chlororespirans DSM 11544]
MILTSQQSLVIIAVIALGTILTRGLPFLLFPSHKETPAFILYLGQVIPFAAIAMLIIYCLKNVSLLAAPYGLPEGIAIGFIIFIHLWKNNVLLSIGGGTVLYMALVQFVFT